MTRRKQKSDLKGITGQYATREDFCRLFADNVDGLYQLAFLLTGDHNRAEHCFVSGIEDSIGGNNVFKEWAHSWAKRTIIQLAIRALQPKPEDHNSVENSPVHGGQQSVAVWHGVVDRLLSLRDFDRFVFVMSVLERYSEHECALLLGCTPPDVREARTRALQHISEGRPPRTEDGLFAEVTSGVGGLHHA